MPKRPTPVTLWFLRLLVHALGSSRRPLDVDDLEPLLPHIPDLRELLESGRAKAQEVLRERLARLEKQGVRREGPLARNVETLAKLFSLSPIETEIVELLAHAEHDEPLGACLSGMCKRARGGTPWSIAAILGLPAGKVRRALRRSAPLAATGLIEPNPGVFTYGAFPLRLAGGLAELLCGERTDPSVLARRFFAQPPAPRIALADFAHVGRDVQLLRRFLAAALSRRRRGVNVLLYGGPGTGKTELARAIAAELKASLYEVSDEDTDGDAITGPLRLRACARAQAVLSRTPRTLLVFDEIEDVFPRRTSPWIGPVHESTPFKARTHRLLEENAVPTIWITNSIAHLEPATLRRFSLSLELRSPPPAARTRLLASALPAKVAEPCVQRLARDERVTLAQIDRAVSVVKLLGVRSRDATEKVLTRVVDLNLAALGPARGGPPARHLGACGYDPALLHTDVDLVRLVESLRRAPSANVCLYGPPGTGKSAFVAYLAERLERPLHAVRASDLLGPFVGQTERALAKMFRDARDLGAVLLLDEADSFLRDRMQARAHWETTQVNELLVQMEAFDGLFFCTTNLVEALDQASLRRFSLKIELRALRAEQRWEMFERLAGPLSGEASSARRALDDLHALTPGDFAAATRRLSFTHDAYGPSELLAALRDEHAMKRCTAGAPRIGFGRHA